MDVNINVMSLYSQPASDFIIELQVTRINCFLILIGMKTGILNITITRPTPPAHSSQEFPRPRGVVILLSAGEMQCPNIEAQLGLW